MCSSKNYLCNYVTVMSYYILTYQDIYNSTATFFTMEVFTSFYFFYYCVSILEKYVLTFQSTGTPFTDVKVS